MKVGMNSATAIGNGILGREYVKINLADNEISDYCVPAIISILKNAKL